MIEAALIVVAVVAVIVALVHDPDDGPPVALGESRRQLERQRKARG